MKPKKDLIAPAETEAETNKESMNEDTHSLLKYVSEPSASGVSTLFDLNQQLYDNGLISKDCYIAIEAVVAEFMNGSIEDGE